MEHLIQMKYVLKDVYKIHYKLNPTTLATDNVHVASLGTNSK